jgi:hypothetical protein
MSGQGNKENTLFLCLLSFIVNRLENVKKKISVQLVFFIVGEDEKNEIEHTQ